MAQKAVSPLSVLTFLCKETPVDRHSSRISENRFSHAPDQQAKHNVKSYKQGYVGTWLQKQHIFEDEDEIVESDEAYHTDEMGVQQSTAHQNLRLYTTSKH